MYAVVDASNHKVCSKDDIKITFEIDILGQIILTDVRLNGSQKKFRFILDTGSTNCFIKKRVLADLGLKATEVSSVSDGFANWEVYFTTVDFTINSVSFDNVKVNIEESASFIDCNIDGIIGANLMKTCIWSFVNGEIKLRKKLKSKEIIGYYKQPMKFIQGVPYILGNFDNYSADMLFDLGFNGDLSIGVSSLSSFKSDQKVIGKGNNGFVSSGVLSRDSIIKIKTHCFHLGKVKKQFFGGGLKKQNTEQMLVNPVIAVEHADAPYSRSLGAGMLEYYNFIIDFPKKNFYSKLINKEYIDQGSFGIVIMPDLEQKFVVAAVWDIAKDIGIQRGSIVEKINELYLVGQDMDWCELNQRVYEELNKNNEIRITINNGRRRETFNLVRRSLFIK